MKATVQFDVDDDPSGWHADDLARAVEKAVNRVGVLTLGPVRVSIEAEPESGTALRTQADWMDAREDVLKSAHLEYIEAEEEKLVRVAKAMGLIGDTSKPRWWDGTGEEGGGRR